MRRIVYIFKRVVLAVIFHILRRFFPVNPRLILFGSFDGFAGSAKYFSEFLMRYYSKDFQIVWVARKQVELDKVRALGFCAEKKGSLKAFLLSLKAKYILFTHNYLDVCTTVRPESILVNLWHGMPIKLVGYSTPLSQKKLRLLRLLNYSCYKRWNYVVAGSEFSGQPYKEMWQVKEKSILAYGQPRTDILFEVKKDKKLAEEISSQVKKAIALPAKAKITLYAPTYRDWDSREKDKEALGALINGWGAQRSENEILLIKPHVNDLEYMKGLIKDTTSNVVLYVSEMDVEMQELLIAAEELISDYSSLIFEYAILERPVFLYTYDIDEYRSKRGGFYYDFEQEFSSYAICHSGKELLSKLQTSSEFCNRGFYKRFNTEGACQKLADFLKSSSA